MTRTIQDVFSDIPNKRSTGNIPFVLVLFTLTSFGLLAIQDSQIFNKDTALLGVLVSAVILLQFYIIYYLFPGIDEIILLMVNTLSILGFVMLQRLTPELALRQVEWFAAGCVILFIIVLIFPRVNNLGKITYPMMILGPLILFLVALLGEESGGATSRLPIGSISVQPAELVKVIFVLVLADSLKQEKTFREKLVLFLFVAASVLGVVLQKDLGGALHYFIVFLFVYQISTNDWLLTGFAAGCSSFFIGYKIFPTVRVSEAWKNYRHRGRLAGSSITAAWVVGLVGLGLDRADPYHTCLTYGFYFAAIWKNSAFLLKYGYGFYALILIRRHISKQSATTPRHVAGMWQCYFSGDSGIHNNWRVVKMIPLQESHCPCKLWRQFHGGQFIC